MVSLGVITIRAMQAFIINLDSAGDRWSFIQESFAGTHLQIRRIPALDGTALRLPMQDFSEQRFRWFHGRMTNPREIGCYLSHIKAMRTFLDTSDDYGLICEDDVVPDVGLEEILARAFGFSRHWNILRLSGLSKGTPLRAAKLCEGYDLCVSLGRLKGAGAYVVDRAAALAFVSHLLPMWLPFDHAFDREWFYGLRAAYIFPFPFLQTTGRFRLSIQKGKTAKQPSLRRWLTTYPYQVCNEMARWLFRGFSYLRMRHLTKRWSALSAVPSTTLRTSANHRYRVRN